MLVIHDNEKFAMRQIVAVRVENFFIDIEVNDDRRLNGAPVAIGGSGEGGRVMAVNDAAGWQGVEPTMPSSLAKRACPGLIIVPPRPELYVDVSKRFYHLLAAFTYQIEAHSCYGAFLDLTDPSSAAVDLRVVLEIEAAVRSELGLKSRAGIGSSRRYAEKALREELIYVASRGTKPFPPIADIRDIDLISAQRLAAIGIDIDSVISSPREKLPGYLVRPAFAPSIQALGPAGHRVKPDELLWSLCGNTRIHLDSGYDYTHASLKSVAISLCDTCIAAGYAFNTVSVTFTDKDGKQEFHILSSGHTDALALEQIFSEVMLEQDVSLRGDLLVDIIVSDLTRAD